MTTTRTAGGLSVSVLAGHITATSQPMHPEVGKQVRMSDDLYFSFTPEIAQQWITVLQKIADEGNNA
jgi:hypothetical protein